MFVVCVWPHEGAVPEIQEALTQEQNEKETRILIQAMSVSNCINGILEREKPMEEVVECTSDAKKSQREEVTSNESNEYIKPKRGRRETAGSTAEKQVQHQN